MQKQNEKHLPDTPSPSTLEKNDLRAKSLKEILALEEKNDFFKEGEIALKTDPNARTTFSGRIIQNNRGGHSSENGDQQKIDRIFTQIAFTGLSMQILQGFTSKIASLASIFTPSVAAKPAAPISHTDANNLYDTERVTAMTYKMLKEESMMIAQREMELSLIDDPVTHSREIQEFAELANSLDMRPHPLTGQFVHCAERVREMEAANIKSAAIIEPPIHNVAVFRAVQPAHFTHAPSRTAPQQNLDFAH